MHNYSYRKPSVICQCELLCWCTTLFRNHDCSIMTAINMVQLNIFKSLDQKNLEVNLIPLRYTWRDEAGLSCSHCLVSQNETDVSEIKWLECREHLELNVCCFQAVLCLGQHPGSFRIILSLFWSSLLAGELVLGPDVESILNVKTTRGKPLSLATKHCLSWVGFKMLWALLPWRVFFLLHHVCYAE